MIRRIMERLEKECETNWVSFFLNIERCHSERSRVDCHSERGTSRGIDVTTMFPISSEARVEKS